MATKMVRINVTNGTSTNLQVITGKDSDNFPIFKPIKKANLPEFPSNITLVEGSELRVDSKAVKGKEQKGASPDNRYFKIVLPPQEVYIRDVDLTDI